MEQLLGQALPVPTYYGYMARYNRTRAEEPRYTPVPMVDATQLAEMLISGTPVVDLRPRRQFADAHCRGALNIELGPNLQTYFGWLVPFFSPFVVVSRSSDELLEGRRLLSRIGREVPASWPWLTMSGPRWPGCWATMKWQVFEHWDSVIDGAARRMSSTSVSPTNGKQGTSGGRRTSPSRTWPQPPSRCQRTRKRGYTVRLVTEPPLLPPYCRPTGFVPFWSTMPSTTP